MITDDVYALGIGRTLHGAPVKLKYYFLSSGETKETRRSPAQLEEAEKTLRQVGEKIRNKDFSPNTSYCPRCEFGKRCANFKPGTIS